jgi:transposase
VQRRFRKCYGKQQLTRQSIYDWSKTFKETGCLCKGESPGRPPVSEETVTRVRQDYTRSPKTSKTRTSLELQLPQKPWGISWVNVYKCSLSGCNYCRTSVKTTKSSVTHSVWTRSNGVKKVIISSSG